jgi:hypothetical protein
LRQALLLLRAKAFAFDREFGVAARLVGYTNMET